MAAHFRCFDVKEQFYSMRMKASAIGSGHIAEAIVM